MIFPRARQVCDPNFTEQHEQGHGASHRTTTSYRQHSEGQKGSPEAILMAKNFQKSVLGLALGNRFLMVSLKAKLKACVGKYRMTLARLPRQKDAMPCSADTRVKQFRMPAQDRAQHFLFVHQQCCRFDKYEATERACQLLTACLTIPAFPTMSVGWITLNGSYNTGKSSSYRAIALSILQHSCAMGAQDWLHLCREGSLRT
jgi:hypothetical protein